MSFLRGFSLATLGSAIVGLGLSVFITILILPLIFVNFFGPGGTLIEPGYDGFWIGLIHGIWWFPEFLFWLFTDRPMTGASDTGYNVGYFIGVVAAIFGLLSSGSSSD